ncbi:DUF1294 domain-containing protein [Vogesella indigofera]|uniref:DUF1294 domain-containing protein n=1 Tax=Vogesella indigofera TaxID=45465 RepID=UPI00234F2B9E|nr:DUF1294 domain-containing protein [Vogesella indigofera]MDC7706935.1 DUF1294 domain-containing protein [Vogesella indigofera]
MSGGARQEKGVISRWQEERGFGFIQPEQGAALFVHVSAFAATPRRPAVGDAVYFLRARDDKGKPRASWAAFAGVPQQAVTAKALPDNSPRPWLAVLFVIALCALYVRGLLPRDVLMLYAVISVLTVLVYHRDKAAALRKRWRTPERTLHWLALLGGWPGAMLAQYWFRHKSTKPAFRRWFWATVLGNGALLGCGLYQGERLLALLR